MSHSSSSVMAAAVGSSWPGRRWLSMARALTARLSAPAALWLPLLAFLALPVPLAGIEIPERGVPIIMLLVGGAVALACRIGRVSWPFAGLLLWGVAHVFLTGYGLRPVQLCLLMAMAGLLFVEAAALGPHAARAAAWVLLASAAVQGVLGLLNLANVLPSPMLLTKPAWWLGVPYDVIRGVFGEAKGYAFPGFKGRTVGWLTHPNFWGSFMALAAVAPAYALLGRWAGALAVALVACSGSVGPTISAAVAFAAMAAHDCTRRVRLALALALVLLAGSVAAYHVADRLDNGKPFAVEHLLSGRLEVWQRAWPYLSRAPVVGNGLGSWRLWADELNRVDGKAHATRQAHNEALQLVFEMGLVGVALAGAWLLTLVRPLRRALTGDDRLARCWAAMALAALVNSFGSPTFHLPAQAGLTLFAVARLHAMAKESR